MVYGEELLPESRYRKRMKHAEHVIDEIMQENDMPVYFVFYGSKENIISHSPTEKPVGLLL